MSSRLLDRLNSARRQRFIGRDAELARFARALTAPEPPFLCAPCRAGRVAWARAASCNALHGWRRRRASAAVTLVDARNVEPTTAAFSSGSVPGAWRLVPTNRRSEALAQRSGRTVLLIDTYELLAPLDDWLRDVFLPELPEQVFTVLASRHDPCARLAR
jgi:hypothetical protein